METISEVLVISSENRPYNCSIYDLKSENLLRTFKEGTSVHKGLALIREDYILSALKGDKAINIWTISKHTENGKMPMPGCVNCLAVTHYGDYCVAGINESIYLWQVSTGKQMDVLQCHSQPITCLEFSSDGTYIISGGKDGLVLVWLLSAALDKYASFENKKPYYVWMDHSTEITDIVVGKLGLFARVVTAALDMTCKIYELETGNLLSSVCTSCEVTAVALDNTEYFLMLGSSDGDIYRINMFGARDGEILNTDSESKFVGHKKAVTCLSVSTFGKYLLSGSDDCSCKLWNMSNFTCIKTLAFEGPITNAFITLTPPGLKVSGHYIPRFIAKRFAKAPEEDSQAFPETRIQDKSLSLTHVETPDEYFETSMFQEFEGTLREKSKSKISPEDLKSINLQLYSYALTDLVHKRAASEIESD